MPVAPTTTLMPGTLSTAAMPLAPLGGSNREPDAAGIARFRQVKSDASAVMADGFRLNHRAADLSWGPDSQIKGSVPSNSSHCRRQKQQLLKLDVIRTSVSN
jgi:hypothetical protein